MNIANAIEYLQPIADSSHIKNYKDAINTVIEAAKKEIPQKIQKEYSVGKRHLYRCRCGRAIPYMETEFENKHIFRYCPGCGQHIKWPKRQNE